MLGINISKNKLLSVVLFLVVFVNFLQSDWSPDLYYLTLEPFENISCHYIHFGDSLPPIEESFDPLNKAIHFHETSCSGKLNSRQGCAAESAARIHPNWQINVLFAGPVSSLNTRSFRALKTYKNIRFRRLHLVDYAKGTPVEGLIIGGSLNRTRWRISHTSDVLRYLSLYKWGGVYLDLDVIVVRSFEELAPNWAARESDSIVAAGALAFSKDVLGRKVADAAIRDLEKNYRGDSWIQNGPGVITRVLQKLCSTTYIADMTAVTCNGFEVYEAELFYPVNWISAGDYFNSKELLVKKPYMYHFWNKITESFPVHRNSAYAKLARRYCPLTYKAFRGHFGS